jgi:shikimate kinase / 3-dehydroquinate synthase
VLVFIGFMGAGKPAAARAAAAALGGRAVDSGAALEERLGTSLDDWFASHGERALREAEEERAREAEMRTGGRDRDDEDDDEREDDE